MLNRVVQYYPATFGGVQQSNSYVLNPHLMVGNLGQNLEITKLITDLDPDIYIPCTQNSPQGVVAARNYLILYSRESHTCGEDVLRSEITGHLNYNIGHLNQLSSPIFVGNKIPIFRGSYDFLTPLENKPDIISFINIKFDNKTGVNLRVVEQIRQIELGRPCYFFKFN